MTNTINTNELRRLRSMKTEMLIVDVLPKDKFDKDHIEGAQNVPLDSPDFLSKVEQAAGRKDKKIVVYCADAACDASAKAAAKLAAAGYGDVTAYKGGIAAWRQDAAEPVGKPEVAGVGSTASTTPAAKDKPAATSWSSATSNKSEPAKPAMTQSAEAGGTSTTMVTPKPAVEQNK